MWVLPNFVYGQHNPDQYPSKLFCRYWQSDNPKLYMERKNTQNSQCKLKKNKVRGGCCLPLRLAVFTQWDMGEIIDSQIKGTEQRAQKSTHTNSQLIFDREQRQSSAKSIVFSEVWWIGQYLFGEKKGGSGHSDIIEATCLRWWG